MTTSDATIVDVNIIGNGDLKLLVAGKKRFRVVRAVMCIASPVWKAMLDPDGHFAESTKEEVEFPDDDTYAFEVLLNIAHLQFNKLPDDLAPKKKFLDSLFLKLVSLCDKYGTMSLIRSFMRGSLDMRALIEKKYATQWPTLWITWMFGTLNFDREHELYIAAMKSIITMLVSDDNGKLSLGPGMIYTDVNQPPGTYGTYSLHCVDNEATICQIRKAILTEIVTAAKNKLQWFYTRNTCTQSSDRDQCQHALIGAFHRTCYALGIVGEPRSTGGDAHNRAIGTLRDGFRALAGKQITTLRGHGHGTCYKPTSELPDEIDAILKKHLTKEKLMSKDLLDQLANRAKR